MGLSDEEVKRMQEEAEKHKDEDEKKAEHIKSKNMADSLIATAEKALKDAGDKVDAKIKEEVEEKVKALKEVAGKDSSTKEEIETATKDLSDVLSSVGQAMYGDQNKTSEPENSGTEEPKTEGSEKKKPEDVEEGQVVE